MGLFCEITWSALNCERILCTENSWSRNKAESWRFLNRLLWKPANRMSVQPRALRLSATAWPFQANRIIKSMLGILVGCPRPDSGEHHRRKNIRMLIHHRQAASSSSSSESSGCGHLVMYNGALNGHSLASSRDGVESGNPTHLNANNDTCSSSSCSNIGCW